MQSKHETGGPRRCSGDTRNAYGVASAAVTQLERSEALLMSQLAVPVPDTPAAASRSAEITFDNKETRNEDVRREIDAAIEGLNTGERWREFLEVSRRFHNYSLNNQMLILLQKSKDHQGRRLPQVEGSSAVRSTRANERSGSMRR